MDMDYILPDEIATEKMRMAYEKLLHGKDASVLSIGIENSCPDGENLKKSTDFSNNNQPSLPVFAPIKTSTNILVLYFIFALGYNLGYGTSIFDANFSMGRFQSQERSFGDLNGLFYRKE